MATKRVRTESASDHHTELEPGAEHRATISEDEHHDERAPVASPPAEPPTKKQFVDVSASQPQDEGEGEALVILEKEDDGAGSSPKPEEKQEPESPKSKTEGESEPGRQHEPESDYIAVDVGGKGEDEVREPQRGTESLEAPSAPIEVPSLPLESSTPQPSVQMTASFEIDNKNVGIVIGKQGERIRNMNAQSGATFILVRDSEHDPRCPTRTVGIQGDLNQIAHAEYLMGQLLDEHWSTRNSNPMSAKPDVWTIAVSENVVSYLYQEVAPIQDETGVRIEISEEVISGSSGRAVHLTGSPSRMLAAQRLINTRMAPFNRNEACVFGYLPAVGASVESMIIGVPHGEVGKLIGRGGHQLRDIQSFTGTRMSVSRDPDMDGYRPVTIIGEESRALKARDIVIGRLEGVVVRSGSQLLTTPPNSADITAAVAEFIAYAATQAEADPTSRQPSYRSQNQSQSQGYHVPAPTQPQSQTPMMMYDPQSQSSYMYQQPAAQGAGGADGPAMVIGKTPIGGTQVELLVHVPSTMIGKVIGKGGQTLREINELSGAYVEVPRSSPTETGMREVKLRGEDRSADYALQIIQQKLSTISGGGGGGGPMGNQSYPNPYYQQPPPQQDAYGSYAHTQPYQPEYAYQQPQQQYYQPAPVPAPSPYDYPYPHGQPQPHSSQAYGAPPPTGQYGGDVPPPPLPQ